MNFLLIIILAFSSITANAMTFATTKIADNASMGASLNSNGVDVGSAQNISFQAVWSGGGSPVGTFTLEVSNDDVQRGLTNPSSNVVNWTTYSNSAIPISADGDLGYNLENIGYRWARIKYTRTSGTATLNIQAVAKSEIIK